MKKNKKKNKKIILIIAIVLILMILILLGISINKKQKDQTENSTNFQTLSDVINYYESKYKKEQKSKKNGYDIDIYLNFKYNLFENNVSKENFFKTLIENIVKFEDYKNIRLIDEEKNITIEVKCDKKTNSITSIYYNGEENYFQKKLSDNSFNNKIDIKEIDPSIQSEILKESIKQDWNYKQVDFGTSEASLNKYNIFFDEGYKVRQIQNKIYNIVYTKNYYGSIIAGLKVGDDFEKIRLTLGDGYENTSEDSLIYKTEDFYIIFSLDEVSIYPNIKYETEKFEELVDNYIEKKDIIDFMDKLTDLWPDYDYYSYDTGYLDIRYSLKGIRISYNVDDLNGIRIYENYSGTYSDEKKDDISLIYSLDKNLICESEAQRQMNDNAFNNPDDKENMKYSSRFVLKSNKENEYGFLKEVSIISLDENYPSNSLQEEIEISDYKWLNDYTLIYSVYGNGIYRYNAETRQTEKLVEGKEEFKLKEYDTKTNTLKYDNKELVVHV